MIILSPLTASDLRPGRNRHQSRSAYSVVQLITGRCACDTAYLVPARESTLVSSACSPYQPSQTLCRCNRESSCDLHQRRNESPINMPRRQLLRFVEAKRRAEEASAD